jgi:hypothetical protein
MKENEPSFATPRDAAKDLIRRQIQRGANLEMILNAHPSSAGLARDPKSYKATVGGTIWRGQYPTKEYVPLEIDQVGVWKLNGEPCFEIFPLHEIYAGVWQEEHPDDDTPGELMEQPKLL